MSFKSCTWFKKIRGLKYTHTPHTTTEKSMGESSPQQTVKQCKNVQIPVSYGYHREPGGCVINAKSSIY